MFGSWRRPRLLLDRAKRRIRHLLGRPNTAPWPLFPQRHGTRQTYIDFIFALDYLRPNSRLVQLFHEAMSPHGLSLLLANEANVETLTKQIRSGSIRPFVFLDLCSRPGSPFNELLHAAAEAGVYTLRKPADDQWILKGYSHPRLEAAGLPVPPTVLFQPGDADRDLTVEERRRLGDRCVIKPSYGEASRGVVVDVKPTAENIASAREFDRSDAWLVQKMMSWGRFGPRPAYLRAYNVLGHRSLLWWSTAADSYAMVTWEEFRRYDLAPCLDIVNRLAELSGMDFFSTEIAITGEPGLGRFCLIDYLNDCCDMDPLGGFNNPPEEWVKWVCARMAEFTWRRKQNLPAMDQSVTFLGDDRPGAILNALEAETNTVNAA